MGVKDRYISATCCHCQWGCLCTNCSSEFSQSYNTFSKLLQKLFRILAKFSHEFVRAGLKAGEGWNRISLCSSGWTYTFSNPPASTSWGWDHRCVPPQIKSTMKLHNSYKRAFEVKLLDMSLNTLECLWYYPPRSWALYQVITHMDVMSMVRNKPGEKLFLDESFIK